jgi:hypothetical protein
VKMTSSPILRGKELSAEDMSIVSIGWSCSSAGHGEHSAERESPKERGSEQRCHESHATSVAPSGERHKELSHYEGLRFYVSRGAKAAVA